MGLTLQEVLVRALKKLKDSSFQRFKEKLSVWEVREEYKNIPKDELTGKDPEHVTGLINEYYRYAYGAEVTLDVLQDIGEKKVREELQCDLKEVDVLGHGLGTTMFTSRVNFVEGNQSTLIRCITEVDPVLCDLRDQGLLTEEQYNDLMKRRTTDEKMEALCDIISHWEDTGKYTAYRVLKKHEEELIKDLEAEEWMRRYPQSYIWDRDHFVNRHKYHIIHGIREVNPVLDDLRSNHLLTRSQYEDLQSEPRAKNKMTHLWNIFQHQPDTRKDQFYISLWRYNYIVINDLEKPAKKAKFESPSPENLPCELQGEIASYQGLRVPIHHFTVQRSSDDWGVSNLNWRGNNNTLSGIEIKQPITETEATPEKQKVKLSRFRIRSRLTLQEVLVRALKKLEDSSFQRFIEKLSVWEVREEYKNIPKDELTGKDPEHVAGLITRYYRYACGAEVTLRLLEDIGENKVREELQQDLREVDIPGDGLGSRMYTDKVNFVDKQQSDLIGITSVDPVLRDLRDLGLLTEEQYNDVMKKRKSRVKMRDLCHIISHWEDTGKYTAYILLRKYNGKIIKNLEAKAWKRINVPSHVSVDIPGHGLESRMYTDRVNFFDNHQSDLIIRITSVDPVLRDLRDQGLLTEEQYNDVMKKKTSREKMKDLCHIISHWEDTGKYTAYIFLRKYNGKIIKILEAKAWMRTKVLSHVSGGAHFVDRHREHLINHVKNVNKIMNDLRVINILGKNKYKRLQAMTRPEEQMRRLLDIFCHQPDTVKDQFYICLWRYNYNLINHLEKSDKEQISTNYLIFETPQEIIQEIAELETNRVKMAVDDISCKLCGEQAQDLACLVQPIATSSVYRLELNSPGLYRCQKTGIKFLVKGPVIIEYKQDSWSDHLKHIPGNTYEILGPLFNIQTRGEPNAVSAVYLPHYLCLKAFNEDPSLIKCAHFRDGNLTLESPAQIEPYYITLENPTFSCLGPLLSIRKKKVPIHGIVLIYFRILCKGDPHEEYKIHLYVLPYSINAEETLDKENKKFGYHRIKKHEHTTDRVYTKVKYLIIGHPGISTHPKTLRFDSEPYQFTEVQLKEKDVNIYLSVLQEETNGTVWDTHLTQGDLKDIEQLLSSMTILESRTIFSGACAPPDHFVDRHREALIQRTSHISPVLDNLLSQRLLNQEQYDTLRGIRPYQEAMRQLYVYMTIWGQHDKEKFYQALKTCNEPLIRDLENTDTVQL